MNAHKNSPFILLVIAVLLIISSACGNNNQGDVFPSVEVFEFGEFLTPDAIQNLVIAANGDLWGSTNHEVIHFDGQSWRSYSPEGLGSIDTLAVGSDGQVWVGGSSLLRFDGDKWVTIADFRFVDDIAIAPAGDVWVAAKSRLSHFDGATWTHYTQSDGLPMDCVGTVAIAPDNTIWAANCYSDHQVVHFDGKAWEVHDPSNGYVTEIDVASDGTIWFGAVGEKGTGAGFSYFNGEIWRAYEEVAGMLDNNIMDLTVDSKGIVWMATEEGVCRFDGERCSSYLPNETVCSVALVSDDEIWLGLRGAIVKLDMK